MRSLLRRSSRSLVVLLASALSVACSDDGDGETHGFTSPYGRTDASTTCPANTYLVGASCVVRGTIDAGAAHDAGIANDSGDASLPSGHHLGGLLDASFERAGT